MLRFKKYYNYTIIDFNSLIDNVSKDLINYYYNEGFTIDKINKFLNIVFLNCLIDRLCSEFNNQSKLIILDDKLSKTSELLNYFKYSDVDRFIRSNIKKLECVFPISLLQYDYTISNIDLYDTSLIFELNTLYNKPKSFKNFINFLKKYGLKKHSNRFTNLVTLQKFFINA